MACCVHLFESQSIMQNRKLLLNSLFVSGSTKSMKLLLRELRYSDKDKAKELQDKLFPIKYDDSFYQEALLNNYLSLGIFDLEKEEKLIGISTVRRSWNSFFSKSRSAYISTFGISEEYRKNGLGFFLLKVSCYILQNYYQCDRITLHTERTNLPAISLYKKARFNIIEVLEGYYSFATPRPDAVFMSLIFEQSPFSKDFERDDIKIDPKLEPLLNSKQEVHWWSPIFSMA